MQDLLTIRADRDVYYYGCDALSLGEKYRGLNNRQHVLLPVQAYILVRYIKIPMLGARSFGEIPSPFGGLRVLQEVSGLIG